MSELVEHARRELELIGEDPETINEYLGIVQIFVKMGPSGGMAAVAIPTIAKLLRLENLTPLTDDPDEWKFVDQLSIFDQNEDIYRSTRNFEVFSNDKGKTYYYMSETIGRVRKYYKSVSKGNK